MRYYILLLLFLQFTDTEAQKHDAFTFFGYDSDDIYPIFGGVTVDFNFSPPYMYKEQKKIDFSSYCGACSDSLGNLLFYTNGISIQHRNHNLMQYGDSLNLSYFWYLYQNDSYPVGSGARAIPAPDKPNQYYLFSMGGRDEPSTEQLVLAPLWYSRIDMNQNNGLGRVLQKNKVMLDVPLNEMALVKHGNGRDWWLIVPRLSKNIMYSFLIDPDGVHPPIEQVIGPPYTSLETSSFCTISPDGNTFVRNDTYDGLTFYDIDRCSGLLSNPRLIPFADGYQIISTVFSPNSRYLYLNSIIALMVMDMQAPDPALTLDTVAIYDGFATPLPFSTAFWLPQQHDDKLYYATFNGTLAWHTIHHPNLPGLAADFEQHSIKLPTYNDGSMCRYPNYRLGKLENSPCDTLNFTGSSEGFKHVPYHKPIDQGQTYKVLSPLRGNGIPEVRMPSMLEVCMERALRMKEEKESKNKK